MAETALFDFSMFVIRQLSSVLFDEVKSALGVEEELDRIKSNLSSIQAVLRDAEKQQSTSNSVANWLGKLQDVMYDIDDLLDVIATEVAIRSKNKGQWRKKVRRFFSRSNFAVLRLLWAHQIKNVCKKLDRVADERRNFVLFTDSVDSSELGSRETHSKVNESDILGRDEDREAIINTVLSCGDCESISVLPIVGLGGIGKTTLAKLIYNDKRVDENFDVKLWVYVSERFNMKKILRQIISMVTGGTITMVQLTMEQLTLEQLRTRVSEALKDKKYCLVLDDLWNEDSNEWRRLKELLDVGAKGSMVVVTTRDLKVASVVQSVEEYRLSELSDEKCLIIFMQLAFKDGEEIEPALMSLANKIVEKSRGIPFLVTALGNLLRGKTDERVWQIVVKKLEEGQEDIMNVLKLSYEQLPSYLKLCFRICSIFGKGTIIHPLVLLPLWMALGFLPYVNRGESLETLEYIGWNCIDELSSKSLFKKTNDLGLFDDFSGLVMHDFVCDLAKSMAGDELAIINCFSKEVSKNIRYVRLDEDFLSGNQSHQRLLKKAKKTRLLMLKTSEYLLSKSFLQSTISNLKCLRVLDLENSQFDELPSTIGYMKHLRYLCLQNNARIKFLPDSICNLLNLQTLLLHGCINLKELPSDIGQLENLRGLSATTQQEVLPQGIGFLTALRILVLKECPRLACLPLSTNQLENLDTLLIEDCKELDLVHGSWSLEGLNSLRILGIKRLPKFQMLPLGVKGLPFTSLKLLMICDCEGLTKVTDWIHDLTSLKMLLIESCPNLVLLPHTFSMLKRLENLRIGGYTLLSEPSSPQEGANSSNIPEIMTAQEE